MSLISNNQQDVSFSASLCSQQGACLLWISVFCSYPAPLLIPNRYSQPGAEPLFSRSTILYILLLTLPIIWYLLGGIERIDAPDKIQHSLFKTAELPVQVYTLTDSHAVLRDGFKHLGKFLKHSIAEQNQTDPRTQAYVLIGKQSAGILGNDTSVDALRSVVLAAATTRNIAMQLANAKVLADGIAHKNNITISMAKFACHMDKLVHLANYDLYKHTERGLAWHYRQHISKGFYDGLPIEAERTVKLAIDTLVLRSRLISRTMQAMALSMSDFNDSMRYAHLGVKCEYPAELHD